MSEDLLLWLVVAGFTLAVWLLERVKAAQARHRRPVAAVKVPAVPIPLPVTTSVPAQEAPVPVSRPATARHAPAARRRRVEWPGRPPGATPPDAAHGTAGIVLAAVLGPCKGSSDRATGAAARPRQPFDTVVSS